LGIIIGLEREWRKHPAGLRTNTLVALGAAMFVTISSGTDYHIAAQVVSGLGFLGAGVILHEGLTIRGLSTAATLWCSGAIGALSGSGHIWEAIVGTICILFIHIALRPVAVRISGKQDGCI